MFTDCVTSYLWYSRNYRVKEIQIYFVFSHVTDELFLMQLTGLICCILGRPSFFYSSLPLFMCFLVSLYFLILVLAFAWCSIYNFYSMLPSGWGEGMDSFLTLPFSLTSTSYFLFLKSHFLTFLVPFFPSCQYSLSPTKDSCNITLTIFQVCHKKFCIDHHKMY